MAGLIGRKIGMTQIFDDNGLSIPVTVVEAGPCYVVQVKTQEKDGYEAVQLGFGDEKEKNATKPVKGHFTKAGVTVRKYLKEFDFSDMEKPEVGTEIKADIFKPGQEVKISGISKGKGFQGTVKRHGFGGGPKTHGQSDRLRAPGSLGQSSYPSRVFKGYKMSGRMGTDRITLKSTSVVRVDAENNLIFIKGPLPGTKNSLIEIRNN
jgi:large subunit ribosomal protein L3